MAVYKPSNFYPHLQEVDLTKQEGNTFSCQVNTDGSLVSGARLNIYTEDNVLVYDNLYQFANEDEINNNPIENRGFAEFYISPYEFSNVTYNHEDKSKYYRYVETTEGVVYYYDEYGENETKCVFETKEEADKIRSITAKDGTSITNGLKTETVTTIIKNKFTISNIKFITLNSESYTVGEGDKFCPYNLYNIKIKDAFCFGLKIIDADNNESLYPINEVDCIKSTDGFDLTIYFPYDEVLNGTDGIFTKMGEDSSGYKFYIVLLNDKNYLWDIKLYEHMFREKEINNGTLITEGYVTGTTKSVLWWDNDKQSKNTLFNKKEVKEDCYVEVTADENNSDLFEDQKKIGRISSGEMDSAYVNIDKDCLQFFNLVDLKNYKIENLFLYIKFDDINSIVKSLNVYETKNGKTSLTQSFDPDKKLKNENYVKIKKITINGNNSYIELEDLIFKNLLFRILKETTNKAKYSIVYKQREKITWVTEDLGVDKNINKIEIENDLDVNLKDGEIVQIYGGDNTNTSYTFFGVRDSDLNVNDIYIRFPGYKGSDFNGNPVNDNQPYYNEKGTAKTIYDSSGKKIELVSTEGLMGNFYNNGNYYDQNKTSHNWTNSDYLPISLYGKNVSYKSFENNEKTVYYGYLDIFNPESVGTSSCFRTFSIDCDKDAGGVTIVTETKTYGSAIPYNPVDEKGGGTLYFNLKQDGTWEMCATTKNHYSSSSLNIGTSWTFSDDYPNTKATPEEQAKKIYNLGIIKEISLDAAYDHGEYKGFKLKFCSFSDESYVQFCDPTSEPTPTLPKVNPLTLTFNSSIMWDPTISFKTIYPAISEYPESYCKLFKVTSYDYETGEFIIAGGLERSILNTDKYEVWQRTVSENMTNEYNITEIMYSYTRLYPPNDKYDEVAYVGDTKVLRDGIKIMNNTDKQIFIQPNINFESDEFNYPYLILDNYNEKITFPYKNQIYDEGVIIQDRTINKLDGSQWLLEYTTDNLSIVPKSGLTYKLYMDTCRSQPMNWFYGRNIVDIDMRVGEYNFIMSKINSEYKPSGFYNKKKNFRRMEEEKIGDYCLIKCTDAYFMATYDNLSVPIKRYRYKIYDVNMNLISDSQYVYSNNVNYAVRGLRNYENYLLVFELEDQLGYVYNYQQKFTVKYTEWEIDDIQIALTVKESQGCVLGDFVTMKKVTEEEGIIVSRDTYDDNGNTITKGTWIPKGAIYADLATIRDFDKLGLPYNSQIHVYRRDTNKLLFPVCDIHLTNDKIITGRNGEHRYGFIDYGVRNNEYYDYVVVLKQKDNGTSDKPLADMIYWYTSNRCKTYFNGWLLVDIEKNDTDKKYYVSDFVWNFKYNLESQDLTQNTSVVQWNNLGKYANTHIGERNYISSGLSCLLGDVGTYLTYDGKDVHEKFGYFEQPYSVVNSDDIYNVYTTEVLTNHIDKYLEWKTFVKNGNPKLLKDYKGNVWIVQILENPNAKNNDVTNEQIYTISFNWVEVDDWKKYSILGKNISYNIDESIKTELETVYFPMWNIEYNESDLTYNLNNLNSNYTKFNVYSNSETPLFVNSIVSISSNTLYGTLSESYIGPRNSPTLYFSECVTETDGIHELIEDQYNKVKNGTTTWNSPFMIVNPSGALIYPTSLKYIDFEKDLKYQNNSIDFICCKMSNLKGVNITLTDNIKTARYAFAKTNIRTNDKYKIIISTNNYIDTKGIFDDITFSNNGIIEVIWNETVNDPNLLLYAELYEQYWDNDNIILNCPKLNFDLTEYDYTIQSSSNTIVLNYYKGNTTLKTSIYIPSNVRIDLDKDKVKENYTVILGSDFYIAE